MKNNFFENVDLFDPNLFASRNPTNDALTTENHTPEDDDPFGVNPFFSLSTTGDNPSSLVLERIRQSFQNHIRAQLSHALNDGNTSDDENLPPMGPLPSSALATNGMLSPKEAEAFLDMVGSSLEIREENSPKNSQ